MRMAWGTLRGCMARQLHTARPPCACSGEASPTDLAVLLLDDGFEVVVHLRARAQRLAERRHAHRQDHELLRACMAAASSACTHAHPAIHHFAHSRPSACRVSAAPCSSSPPMSNCRALVIREPRCDGGRQNRRLFSMRHCHWSQKARGERKACMPVRRVVVQCTL